MITADDISLDMTPAPEKLSTPFIGHREKLAAALYGRRFETFITILILANAIVLAMLTYNHDSGEDAGRLGLLIRLDLFIIVIFSIEIAAKIYALGGKFFKSGWNVFDLCVVVLSAIGPAYPLSIIRALRVLRTLRLVTRVKSMRIVVESFLRALPGIGSVLMVMLMMMFIFAVIGTRMFGDIAPELFGTFHDSVFTLFMVLTLEGWPDIAAQVIPHVPFARAFFVVYIAVNSFTVLNLMIAVIVDAMQSEYEAEAEEEREDMIAALKALKVEISEMRKQIG